MKRESIRKIAFGDLKFERSSFSCFYRVQMMWNTTVDTLRMPPREGGTMYELNKQTNMFLHFLKKDLMKALFERTTFFLSSANNLSCIVCVYLIFRVIDVFSTFRRRRLRVSNKRCLICRQKLSINTSCLCFFMRCLKNICRRVICN